MTAEQKYGSRNSRKLTWQIHSKFYHNISSKLTYNLKYIGRLINSLTKIILKNWREEFALQSKQQATNYRGKDTVEERYS